MAERRMFTKKITLSDAFLDMPVTARLLYYDLNMQADDDGFVGNPKTVIRITGARDDDMKILLAKRFILAFESGIIVIKHWKMHNCIQSDRYKQTVYKDELESLTLKENKAYTECIQNVNKLETQVRLVEGSIVEEREEPTVKISFGEEHIKNPVAKVKECKQSYDGFENVKLTEKEYQSLINDYGKANTHKLLNCLDSYKLSSGKKYKSDMGAIRMWVLGKFNLEKRHIAACPRCGATPFAVICKCGYTQGDTV